MSVQGITFQKPRKKHAVEPFTCLLGLVRSKVNESRFPQSVSPYKEVQGRGRGSSAVDDSGVQPPAMDAEEGGTNEATMRCALQLKALGIGATQASAARLIVCHSFA